jgi:hypothetical protein
VVRPWSVFIRVHPWFVFLRDPSVVSVQAER